jgi:ribosomal protein S18 acetylase RimI-like enzyme
MGISAASLNDIPELVKLVNSAYRGEASTKGWTTEAHLLEGELRTDENSLKEMMAKPGVAMLKYCNEKGRINGCVYLKNEGNKIYLGMLTVSPELQGAGIGKILLSAADDYAKQQNCNAIFMTVISVRHELIAWYERHGYKQTGEKRPFPTDTRFGVPTRPLEFVVLEKNVSL